LLDLKAVKAMMSGSGPTCLWLFEKKNMLESSKGLKKNTTENQ